MLRPHFAQLGIEVIVTEELPRWDEVFADLVGYFKSGEWKQPVLDVAGEFEGGDECRDRPGGRSAVRKANRTK